LVWYKNLDRSFFRYITMPEFDRRTDRQTDSFVVTRPPCIQCSAVKVRLTCLYDNCLLVRPTLVFTVVFSLLFLPDTFTRNLPKYIRGCGLECRWKWHSCISPSLAVFFYTNERFKCGLESRSNRFELLLFTLEKSHTGFPLIPKLVRLNYLEPCNGPDFALFHRNRYIWWI